MSTRVACLLQITGQEEERHREGRSQWIYRFAPLSFLTLKSGVNALIFFKNVFTLSLLRISLTHEAVFNFFKAAACSLIQWNLQVHRGERLGSTQQNKRSMQTMWRGSKTTYQGLILAGNPSYLGGWDQSGQISETLSKNGMGGCSQYRAPDFNPKHSSKEKEKKRTKQGLVHTSNSSILRDLARRKNSSPAWATWET